MQKQHLIAVSFPKINIFSYLGSWLALIMFMHDTLQLNNSSISFSSRFDELRGDFLFSKEIFQKFFKNTPPRFVSHFKQVKGYKNFFEIRRFWVCISAPFVQMSERSFFYGKTIKEIKTGMGIIHQSQNRQKNIQRLVP
jgi:hypothetical protein